MQQATLVTLTLFVAGLIYHAGRMSARLEHVESAVKELKRDIDTKLAEIQGLLRALVGRRHDDLEDT